MNFGNPGYKAMLARGRLKPGQMNRTEQQYATHLDVEKHAGRVLWWRHHAIKLKLADNTFFEVDFFVLAADGVLEAHEVKGGIWIGDGRTKIKIAADLYPFRFKAFKVRAKKNGGGWEEEDFSRSDAVPHGTPTALPPSHPTPKMEFGDIPFVSAT